MKIAVIGPVAPFVSGISQHTSALTGELQTRDDLCVKTWSFSRQYPVALFPGEKQKSDAAPLLDTHFTIDTINPLTWHATLKAIKAFEPDLAIVPAWTFFTAPALGAIASGLRKGGVEVVSVVHNARDHEAAGWKNTLLAWQIAQSSRVMTHNEPLAQTVREIAPTVPTRVSPHPLYDTFPMAKGILPRRAALELLYFGIVRSYKGLDILIDALGIVADRDIVLTIAGEFWGGSEETEQQIARLGLNAKVEIRAGFASEEDAAELFTRCDYLVAPYRSATGSGVIAIAQHYKRPVIASDISGLREAVCDGETGWLFPAEDPEALAQVLTTKASAESAKSMRPALEAQCEALSWSTFCNTLIHS
ncbi:MAG: glycosyltransferase [Erythrobacter sp.]|nr:glycosyltransferase [Erythrobacter sp.]